MSNDGGRKGRKKVRGKEQRIKGGKKKYNDVDNYVCRPYYVYLYNEKIYEKKYGYEVLLIYREDVREKKRKEGREGEGKKMINELKRLIVKSLLVVES